MTPTRAAVAAVLLAVLLPLLPAPAAPQSRSEVVEEIVAVVNDEVITLSQYRTEWRSMSDSLRTQMQGESLDKELTRLKGDFLNMMITDVLLLQKARALNLNVADQVRQAIENIKTQNNIASDDDLKRALQQQGMTYEQFRKQIEENWLKQAVLYSEVDRSITLDDSQVVQYYREHPAEFTVAVETHVRAIYLALAGKDPQALETARAEIDRRLAAGEDFGTVAEQLSDSPLKESKGDLGRFKAGELDKALEGAVDKLQQGQTAPWVETANGWYRLRLEERTPAHLQPFDQVKKEVEEKLYTSKQVKKRDEYIKKLRADAFVDVKKPDPASLLEG